MLSYTDLNKGILFIMDGAPYEVLEVHFLRMQQRKAVVQTKIRNLMTGKVLDRNFQSSDSFEEAEIEKRAAVFIYKKAGRGADAVDEYWFNEKGNPGNRFVLSGDILGDLSTGSGHGKAQFLKPNTEVATMVFNDKVIKATLPVKMEFKVLYAPPSINGNTAQGGTKVVTLEGGAKINAPLFVNQDDLIRINTVTGEYVERVEKK